MEESQGRWDDSSNQDADLIPRNRVNLESKLGLCRYLILVLGSLNDSIIIIP